MKNRSRLSFHARFRVQLLYRVISLVLVIFLLSYLVLETELYATILILSIVTIYLVFSIYRFVERTNLELVRFFDAIKYSDFSQSYITSGLGSAFDDLRAAFAEVILKFQQTRSETEEHYRYLQNVVQHVGIGLIAFYENGEIELFNTAARRLLGTPRLKNLKSLKVKDPKLAKQIQGLKSGEKVLTRYHTGGFELHLAIYATAFKLRGRLMTLVSIQDIGNELEEKEMEAWQKLIRVLTHEIMNSITPIASLAGTTREMLATDDWDGPATVELSESVSDVRSAVDTIQSRSEGLLRFVDSYRSLAKLPKPDFQLFEVATVFDRLTTLLAVKFEENQIQLVVEAYPPRLELTADPQLVEQLLINLLLNAERAVAQTENALIKLTAHITAHGKVMIQVIDNGCGIPEDIREKIFVPFFSTNKNGSGIGLSLCRQIMRLHNGTISVHSEEGGGATFVLRF